MANPNVFAQYLQPVRSVSERIAALDEADFRRAQMEGAVRQNKLQELAFQRGEQERAAAEARANRLRGLATESGGDEAKYAEALRGAGEFGMASEIEKARGERLKTQTETLDKRLGMFRTQADRIGNRAQAIGWIQAQFADPVVGPLISRQGTLEQVLAEVPDDADPQAFARWRMQEAQGLSKVQEHFAPKPTQVDLGGRKVMIDQNPNSPTYGNVLQDYTVSNAAKDLLIPGPDGKMVPNEPLIQAESRVGAAKAPKTTIDMTGGQKGFENETKLRDNFKQEPVYKAHQEMDSAHRQIIDAINQKSPIGDMAAATKIMKLLDPGSVVRESELGMAMQATGLMDYLTNYAGNIINGTKLTPTQRKEFAELANALYAQSVEQFNKKRDEYLKLGGEYGLNAERALGTVARPAPPKTAKKGEAAPSAPPDIDALLKKYGGK